MDWLEKIVTNFWKESPKDFWREKFLFLIDYFDECLHKSLEDCIWNTWNNFWRHYWVRSWGNNWRTSLKKFWKKAWKYSWRSFWKNSGTNRRSNPWKNSKSIHWMNSRKNIWKKYWSIFFAEIPEYNSKRILEKKKWNGKKWRNSWKIQRNV